MKTTTHNNGRRLQGMVLIVVAGLIPLNLFAQKSINNYEIQKFTDNLFRSTEDIISAFTRTNSAEMNFDEDVELEDWMMDLDQWRISLDSGSVVKEDDVPEPVKITDEPGISQPAVDDLFEDWMFRTDWLKAQGPSAMDDELEFEPWMMKPFNSSANMYCANNEDRD